MEQLHEIAAPRERDYSFTVITVSFNNAATIAQTIESVLAQTWTKLDYWVIDGGSDDGTVEILRSYKDRIRWISESDEGLYFAMNKGLQRAEGEYVGFLNADDFFAHPRVIAEMVATLKKHPDSWAVYGDIAYVDAVNTEKILRYWKSGSYRRSAFKRGWMPPHPAFYLRRDAFVFFQGFNAGEFTSAADYELMLRMLYRNRLSAVYSPGIKVRMRTGGISNRSLSNRIRANREDAKAWEINQLKPAFYTFWLKPLRKIFQYILRP
jgi:glycosyltransferase involved in cell wall biosynthesis